MARAEQKKETPVIKVHGFIRCTLSVFLHPTRVNWLLGYVTRLGLGCEGAWLALSGTLSNLLSALHRSVFDFSLYIGKRASFARLLVPCPLLIVIVCEYF